MPRTPYTSDQFKTIGANIRRLREPRWTLKEAAALVRCGESTLAYIERGRPGSPQLYHRIAHLLGVTVDALAEARETAGAA